jgi:NAD(P)-dependent dehydrogenase (short-subunit alcohol dehydrogenase family)
MYNPFSLKGKTVIVTGASSGIGRAIAVECSKMGASVIITGRDPDRLDLTFRQMAGEGHTVLRADMTSENDLEDIAGSIPEIDGIVYSAGVLKTLPVKFINRGDLDAVMDVNFFAPVFLTKAIINRKKLRRGGSVVFISSLAAFYANPGNAMYSASKGALNSFARVMALELSQRKIRVNCILPGMVKTNLLDIIPVTTEDLNEDRKNYPLDYGDPVDVAYAAVYLLSEAGRWITGNYFVLDGGASLK